MKKKIAALAFSAVLLAAGSAMAAEPSVTYMDSLIRKDPSITETLPPPAPLPPEAAAPQPAGPAEAPELPRRQIRPHPGDRKLPPPPVRRFHRQDRDGAYYYHREDRADWDRPDHFRDRHDRKHYGRKDQRRYRADDGRRFCDRDDYQKHRGERRHHRERPAPCQEDRDD